MDDDVAPESGSAPGRPTGQPSGHDRLAPLAGPCLALAAFAALAAFGGDQAALAGNVAISRQVRGLVPDALAQPLGAVLALGSSQVSVGVVVALAALLWRRGRRRAILSLGLLFVGVAIELVSKSALLHPGVWPELHRAAHLYPFAEVSTSGLGVPLVSPFPSGHTMRTTYVALVGADVAGEWLGDGVARAVRVLAWALALAAGLAVVYFGWHWATDALGGAALGSALAGLAAYSGGRASERAG